MSGLKRGRILQAVETMTSRHKRVEGSFQIALDYDVAQVSKNERYYLVGGQTRDYIPLHRRYRSGDALAQMGVALVDDNDDTDCGNPLAHPHHRAYAPRRLCCGFWHLNGGAGTYLVYWAPGTRASHIRRARKYCADPTVPILFKGRLRKRPRKSARLASAVDRRRRAVSKVPRWRSHEVAKEMPLQTLRVDAR